MNVLDHIKETVKIIQKMDNIDLYKKILDLQAEVMDLIEENRNLKNRLEIKDDIKFIKNSYWIVKNGEMQEGPYCSRCYDYENKLVHLIKNEGYHPSCPQCKQYSD